MTVANTTAASQLAQLWTDPLDHVCARRTECTSASSTHDQRLQRCSSSGEQSVSERAATEAGSGSSFEHALHIRTTKGNGNTFVLAWLRENYELSEGVCLPRCTLYEHYLDLCSKTSMTPVNSASFGKVIRQEFPTITTRRLGTRGQSKYHYYGLAIKSTSPYYDSVMKIKDQPVKPSAGFKQESGEWDDDEVTTLSTSIEVSNKSLMAVQRFPKLSEVFIPDSLDVKKVETFLTMYTTHCQRFMDTVLRASFNDINGYLLHFWAGMPEHLSSIIGHRVIVHLVRVCDTILYSALADILISTPVMAIPDSLKREIQTKLTLKLEDYICGAMNDQPQVMLECKLREARSFCSRLHERMQTSRLAQGVNSIFKSSTAVETLRAEWKMMEKLDALHSTLFISPDHMPSNKLAQDRLAQEAVHAFQEFEQFLASGQASVETYADWLSAIVDRVMNVKREFNNMTVEEAAESVVLHCNIFLNQVLRELVCKMSSTFGLFDILREFTLAYIEHLVGKHLTRDRLAVLRKQLLEGVHYDLPPSPLTISSTTAQLFLPPTTPDSDLMCSSTSSPSPLHHPGLPTTASAKSCHALNVQTSTTYSWSANPVTLQQSPVVTSAAMSWSSSWKECLTPSCRSGTAICNTVNSYRNARLYSDAPRSQPLALSNQQGQGGHLPNQFCFHGTDLTNPQRPPSIGVIPQAHQSIRMAAPPQQPTCTMTSPIPMQPHQHFFRQVNQQGQPIASFQNSMVTYGRMSAFSGSPGAY